MRFNSSSGEWRGSNGNNPACERTALLITRHLDGELEPGDARDLRMHLAVCPHCRSTMEAQSAQSRELSDKLKTLWIDGEHVTARKKKVFRFAENVSELLRLALMSAACLTLIGCALYLAGTAEPKNVQKTETLAPSAPALASTPISKPAIIPEEPKKIATTDTRPTPSTPVALPEKKASPEAQCGIITDLLANPDEDGLDAEATAALIDVKNPAPIETSLEKAIVVLPPPKLEPVLKKEETFAAISEPAPLTPVPGVSMKYALDTREEGKLTLLGDVAGGKAVIHFETTNGHVIEALQGELDSTLDPAHAALARRLIREAKAMK